MKEQGISQKDQEEKAKPKKIIKKIVTRKVIKKKEEVSKDDALVEWEGGKFVVDEISLLYVSGTTIDWKEELFGSQFTVENPNATSGCGCGESFSL